MAEFEGDWDWESLLMYSNQEEDAHVTSSPMGSTAETAFAPFEPAGVRSDAGPSLSFDGTRYREDKPTGFTADLVALQSRSLVTQGHSITGKLHSLVLEEDIDMSRPQRAKLIQFLDRLAAGRFRLLHGESHGNTSSEKSEEGTENYSREFAYKCIDASYVDPQGVPTLLDREDLERLIDRVMDKAAVFPAGLTLLNAILAIGSHCLNLKDSTSSASRANYPVSQFFDKALKFRHQIPAEASLEKLQSLLVMSYFASRTGSILASSLIAEATCCAQGLRLNSTPAIQRTHAGPIEQETARRAFWFLYCLEKPHCLREGTFPLVNEAFIDHTPPRLLNSFGKSDWLLINSRDTVDSIEILERALKAWEKELPFPCDTPLSNRMMNYSTLTCTDRRLRLSNLYRYHGAVIAIQILQSCQSNTQWDEEICCQSARTILSACYCISLSDVQYDWSLYYFPSIATCVLFIILIRKGNSQKDLSYIGIASGFFGRLSLDADVPFDEITELINRMDRLKQIWADVLCLGVDEFGESDSFFELGGDSVKAIQLLGETALLAPDTDLDMLYKYPTLSEFYSWAKDNTGKTQIDPSSKGYDYVATQPPSNTVSSERQELACIAPGIKITDLQASLKDSGLESRTVVKAARITPIQEFFMTLAMAGNVGLLNYVYEVEGPLLLNGLQQLIQHLENKNPILRTTIVKAGDEYIQVALEHSLSEWVHSTNIQEYMQHTMTLKMTPGARPVQYCLIMNDDIHGKNFFIISIHHMFCDAFSRYLIEKEMLHILHSPATYLQEPERPWFGDFVTHLHETRTDNAVSEYWEKYLNGSNLANIHPHSLCPEGPGELDGEIIEVVPASVFSSQSQTASHTQLILAAWSLALAKLSGLRDITFGLCRHGRSHPYQDVRRMVGPLVSATPLRIDLTQYNERVEDLVQRVQDEVLATAQWEQGLIPGVYNLGDGRPFVQSLVNLKSELYAMPEGYTDDEQKGDIWRMVTRRDLQDYDMKSDWPVLLLIHQQKGVFRLKMYYQSSLVSHEKAATLFHDLKHMVDVLAGADEMTTVGGLLA
ncbi:transcriptional regulator family: Fungal Specific TF [Aspergillus niger]|nr:transcriptional regulator family: Fungal Specific TF [Aspergillus niger]KAI2951055.1 transcriptional regulator family: Fungal Specific TF [Aspergillus niger]KAI2953861.1 transcriptional regulator family: Fungal Specific TF [Aspergillus niger]KAI2971076.1 transcriptional regulator family: Fungal Specific TF [Aspergillus niger]KAI3052445.1 transcriptional regulator family: Fungal Specific TF [Aspergillus niger]